MKRIYRVTLVLERTFDRTATGEAKDITGRVGAFAFERGWGLAEHRITNRARSDRKPCDVEPDPARIEEDIAAGQALATLREIASDMAAILGNVKKPRVEYAPNRWCNGKFTYNVAHAHIQNGVRWIRGPRKGRKIPKGLICISRRKLLKGIGAAAPEMWPWLIAHELMHVRMPGGSHKRAKFNENADDLLRHYAASKGIVARRFPSDLGPRITYECASCKAISLPPATFSLCPVCGAKRQEAGVHEPGWRAGSMNS